MFDVNDPSAPATTTAGTAVAVRRIHPNLSASAYIDTMSSTSTKRNGYCCIAWSFNNHSIDTAVHMISSVVSTPMPDTTSVQPNTTTHTSRSVRSALVSSTNDRFGETRSIQASSTISEFSLLVNGCVTPAQYA